VEVPIGQWQDLIPSLLERITQTNEPLVKKSTLQCIGFICETVYSDHLASQSNAILTAVAEGARKEQSSPEVRLAALQALMNSLSFIKENFEREDERNYVMQIVCESTQSTESADLQVIGFECLVKIVGMYYDYMGLYMQKALYGLTVLGMRHENEKVVLQAIEFWSTICEIEYDRNYAIMEGDNSLPNLGFAQTAMPELVPVVLWVMTKQDEDDDGDEWTPSMAAATCLQLLASVCGSNIVNNVLPFIQENISNADWKFRETACMAFGSIIDGPEPSHMAGLVTMALPVLLQLVSDPVVQVKDTAAWTLGRICENLLSVIKTEEFQAIIQAIVGGLNDNPRIAGSCAWSITCVAEQLGTKERDAATCNLSPYFEPLLTALMSAAQKQGQDPNFQQSAFEAISVMIENSARDVAPIVHKLSQMVMEQLQVTFQNAHNIVGDDDRRAHHQYQANMCSIFTSIVHYDPMIVRQSPDMVMSNLLSVITGASRDSTVKEEAFVAVGAVAGALEQDFNRYMGALIPFITQCLTNHEEHAVCSIVLGVIGDICRALGDQILPYCDTLMAHIGQLLNQPAIHRKIRPACLSAIGDISLAIGGNFEVYVHPAMTIIGNISNELGYVPQNTQEQYEYVMDLRESIAEAYTGICQGLKMASKGSLLINYAQQVFGFLEVAAQEADKTESYVKIMMGLLG
jgi:importin subunit beta-1